MRLLLWLLALAVASGLALYFAHRLLLASRPLPSYELAFEVKRALLAGRLSGLSVEVEVRPMTVNLTLDGRSYRVPASRVLVAFEARGAPTYEESASTAWRVWGDGRRAGAISYLEVSDDGRTVYIAYFNTTPYRGSSACVRESRPRGLRFYTTSGGEVPGVYRWVGRREVLVLEREVGPCG